MPRYRVTLEVDGLVGVDVDATDEAQAREKALALVPVEDWCVVVAVEEERLSE